MRMSGPRVLVLLVLAGLVAAMGGAVLPFLLLGGVVVWDDIKRKKVANKWIAMGLGATIFGYLLAALRNLFSAWGWFSGLPPGFFVQAGLHAGLSTISAVLLWYWKVWPAGDAKLFIVCAIFLPLINPVLRGFPDHLFLVMLINVFFVAGLYLGVVLLGEWSLALRSYALERSRLSQTLKGIGASVQEGIRSHWAERRKLGVLGWNTFALFMFLRPVQSFLRLPALGVLGQLSIYIGLYLVWDKLRSFFLRWDVAGVTFFIVTVGVLPWSVWRWNWLASLFAGVEWTTGWWVFLRVANLLLDVYLQRARVTTVALDEVRPGMLLAPRSWGLLLQMAMEADPSDLPRQYADGLSTRDVVLLNDYFRCHPVSRIEIYRTRPFSLWIMLGCLWSIFIRQNIIECLASLTRSR